MTSKKEARNGGFFLAPLTLPQRLFRPNHARSIPIPRAEGGAGEAREAREAREGRGGRKLCF